MLNNHETFNLTVEKKKIAKYYHFQILFSPREYFLT